MVGAVRGFHGGDDGSARGRPQAGRTSRGERSVHSGCFGEGDIQILNEEERQRARARESDKEETKIESSL